MGGSARSPRQRLPPATHRPCGETTTTTTSAEKFPSEPAPVPRAGWAGCGMHGATGRRLSSRERRHGCSIPPGGSAAWRTRSRRPAPMHNARTSTTGRKTGSLLHFDRPAAAQEPRGGYRGRTLRSPHQHPEGKEETEAAYRPAPVEEDWAAPAPLPPPRRLSPPAPSPAGDGG